MVITIKKGMSREQAKKMIDDALQINWRLKKKKKTASLHKLGGLLSRLKMTPLEMQKEMRDGWLE